jgi:hypothetical protein
MVVRTCIRRLDFFTLSNEVVISKWRHQLCFIFPVRIWFDHRTFDYKKARTVTHILQQISCFFFAQNQSWRLPSQMLTKSSKLLSILNSISNGGFGFSTSFAGRGLHGSVSVLYSILVPFQIYDYFSKGPRRRMRRRRVAEHPLSTCSMVDATPILHPPRFAQFISLQTRYPTKLYFRRTPFASVQLQRRRYTQSSSTRDTRVRYIRRGFSVCHGGCCPTREEVGGRQE